MLLPILLVSGLCLTAFGFVFFVLARRTAVAPCDVAGWLENFSAASYRPMERLFDNRDQSFLAAQKGFEPSIARQLRRERREIYHDYLRGMVRDFHNLMKAAKYVTVYSNRDQSAFEINLWRVRLNFYCAIVSVEARIQLERLGLGTVNTGALFVPVERLRQYAQAQMPAFQ